MLKEVLQEMLYWVYPQTCLLCAAHLSVNQQFICSKCLLTLPETDNNQFVSNHIQDKFTGRAPITQLYVPYYYEPQSTKVLIKKVKYSYEPKLGILLGNFLGHKLSQQPWINDLEYIIPVPLYKSKKNERGYNQALLLCEGIQQIHKHLKILPDLLLRDKKTKSQTTKNRAERLENIQNAFSLNEKYLTDINTSPKILIIDDVLTTGATLESCILILSQIKDSKIYVSTFAMAVD